jgi:amino acid adenylation domain-containing protein
MSNYDDLSKLQSQLSPARKALLERWKRGEVENVSTLRAVSRDQGALPLSFGQQRWWFLEQLLPHSPSYNLYTRLTIVGRLNIRALEWALREVIKRHEILRTRFEVCESQPVQVITSHSEVANSLLPVIDLNIGTHEKEEAELYRHMLVEAQSPFYIDRGPLLRATLLRLREQKYVLLLTMHHIAGDAWSFGVLCRELSQLYNAYVQGHPLPLAPLPIQYADFAVWQRQRLQGDVLEQHLAYWRIQLAELPTLNLSTDFPRPAIETFRGASHRYSISHALTTRLKELSQREGVTLFMTLLAAFQVLLLRYSGQDDIVVGSPIANRTHHELEGLIGFFVNTLVLRTDLSGNPTFVEALRRVREMTLGAYAHQDLPFERLVEEVQPERSLSHNPLCQVLFQIRQPYEEALDLQGLVVKPLDMERGTARFDLVLSLTESEQGLRGQWEYSTDLFEPATIERMAAHFSMLLEGIVTNPGQHLADLPLLSATERHKLVHGWNATRTDFPRQWCMHQLFEIQVERTPETVAIVSGEQHVTYAKLNRQANQLAHALREMGVGPEVCIGVCLKRSIAQVAALLAIFKAEGVYLPLDPTVPIERLAFIVEDAQPRVLLANEELVASLAQTQHDISCTVVSPPAIWQQHEDATANLTGSLTIDYPAYVLYTSGSTGQPKGVQIPHRGLLNLLFWHQSAYHLRIGERSSSLAGLAFDASIWECCPPLTVGASLVLCPDDIRLSAVHLRDWLVVEGIAMSFVPTPLAEQLIHLDWSPQVSLRALLTGGDKLHTRPDHRLPFPVLNHYGPTECSVVSSAIRVEPEADSRKAPSIGRPIANTETYVLDEDMQPVPVGVPGELYIGGVGLARGYLRQPGLTAERFVPHPYSCEPGARLYRTGDQVRWLDDGTLEFLGRLDEQVKLRGFRIELGEIEMVLQQHPLVQECVVLMREDVSHNKSLVAYVAGTEGLTSLSIKDLQTFLRTRVPDYMIPAAFVLLSTLPLLPSGKLDRQALLASKEEHVTSADSYIAPGTPIEELIAEIWQQVLGIERIGRQDDFFALGGHSLLAMQVITRIQEALEVDIPLRALFEAPTIAELSEQVEDILLHSIENLTESEAQRLLDNY